MQKNDACVQVDFALLERFMTDAFAAVGVPVEEAAICAAVLIEADKHGVDSHGIGRFKSIYYNRIKDGIQSPTTEFEIVRETATTAVIDGHHGMGHVIGTRSMAMAMAKAQAHGLGMVAVRNSTHYGYCGRFVRMATAADMIGATGTNARPSIAPTGGVDNMLGTNPLVFGIPTDEAFPFVIDCATSVTQRGKIEVYERAGQELPEGWVIGRDGTYKTDTSQVLKDLVSGDAALVPVGGMSEETGGHKGYGWAMVVELLSAMLQDGAYLKGLLGFDEAGNKQPYKLGHFFLAIDVAHFIDPARAKAIAGDICRQVRNSTRAPGCERIYTAGEKEHRAWLERKNHGAPVGAVLAQELIAVRDECGLDYRFPFED